MIRHFLDFLRSNNIDYRVTNGYNNIIKNINDESDFDFLFKKRDFIKIDLIINNFCNEYNYKVVQLFHQQMLAKNFFIYNEKTNELLNLDLYGELSRNGIVILKEKDVFYFKTDFKGILILKPNQEFIQYFIKKVEKQNIDQITFEYLCDLYCKETIKIDSSIKHFFRNTHHSISKVFISKNHKLLTENLQAYKNDFIEGSKDVTINRISNFLRIIKRIRHPTGITICFLGPDGSGKSTVIETLLDQTLPFRRSDYFHLKPVLQKEANKNTAVTDPQGAPLYSKLVSFIKLIYYFFLYNLGWLKNIMPNKIKSSLIIFDRYYDDILVDNRRFRYDGSIWMAKAIRTFIPRPKLYFILTTEADIIYKRKQEVSIEELKRQIVSYRGLGDGKRYFNIDVDRTPKEIVKEITNILMNRMNERY